MRAVTGGDGMAGMATQVFELTVDGHHHRVETSLGDGWKNEATWWVDGEQVATQKASEDNLYLSPEKGDGLADVAGAVRVRFTMINKPVRATWFGGSRTKASAASYVGTGGIDLVPEPGSPAAEREERMRANPRAYAARHVAGGVGKVVVPIIATAVVVWLLSRISLPDWDLGLPSIPWPDLPSIPWPEIPWPSISLPSWDAPGWLRWILDKVKYVWPILLGLWLARREVTRRREQDELRARVAATGSTGSTETTEPAGERSAARDVPADEAEDTERQQDHAGDPRDE